MVNLTEPKSLKKAERVGLNLSSSTNVWTVPLPKVLAPTTMARP